MITIIICIIIIIRLKSTGTAAGQRSGTVRAIAEKLNIMLPGIYDASAYDEWDINNKILYLYTL